MRSVDRFRLIERSCDPERIEQDEKKGYSITENTERIHTMKKVSKLQYAKPGGQPFLRALRYAFRAGFRARTDEIRSAAHLSQLRYPK